MSDNVYHPPFPANAGVSSGDASASGDVQVALGGRGPHDPGMEARVAVLEEIAVSTKAALGDIRSDLKGIREKQDADFRGLLYMGAGAALGVVAIMAKGFHWW